MRVTQFKSVGIGYVLSNKELYTTTGPKKIEKTIEVYLPEQNNVKDGEILPATKDLKYSLTDINEFQRQGKITTANSIPATWLPMTTNHMVPPSVRRGERVEIYRVGDEDKYYWRVLGLDDNLRRRDTIVIAISNTTDEDAVLDFSNTYWLEFSTHSKRVALVTTQSDGEPFGYEAFFNTKDGEFRIIDTANNYMELISEKNLMQLVSADKAFHKVERNTVQSQTPEGAEYYLNGENITSRNAAGCESNMVDGVITLRSSEGGSLVIDQNVVAKSASGDELNLSGGTSVLKAGTGGAITIANGKVGGP